METKKIKLIEFNHYTGSSYDSFNGFYESTENLLECLSKTKMFLDSIKFRLENELRESGEGFEIKSLNYKFKTENRNVVIEVSDILSEKTVYKTTPEVKQEGLPYVPEKKEKIIESVVVPNRTLKFEYREKEILINAVFDYYHKAFNLKGEEIKSE